MSETEPLVHWTPEEEFYAACGASDDYLLGILNPGMVTCPACRVILGAPECPGSKMDDGSHEDSFAEDGEPRTCHWCCQEWTPE